MYTDSTAEITKNHSGKSYQPSNGTEGEIFMKQFCQNCQRDNLDPETCEGGCDILVRTMAFNVDDDEYPSEWIIGTDGQPTCTAFERSKTDEPTPI